MPAPLQVTCPECGRQFEAPASMRGGIANCPACRRAVPVPGGPELLFRVLISGGVLLILTATALTWLAGGLASAAVVFGLGALIMAAVFLAS
jgi:hypothetical protein